MMSDDTITIRVHGLTPDEIFDKLGGFGRDKPVRAIYVGADLFAVVEQIREMSETALFEYKTVDPFELKKIIQREGEGG
ncbi:MAG: hypothetical protein GY854_19760 [Deltaproteobacteria bacterium]|nr:hypothetical protein [Deltaproteobacteria bacterium]